LPLKRALRIVGWASFTRSAALSSTESVITSVAAIGVRGGYAVPP
jgi:hypothetical protein